MIHKVLQLGIAVISQKLLTRITVFHYLCFIFISCLVMYRIVLMKDIDLV